MPEQVTSIYPCHGDVTNQFIIRTVLARILNILQIPQISQQNMQTLEWQFWPFNDV